MPERFRRLLWPALALLALLGYNAIANPGFFALHLADGRLSGAIIDVLNQGAPTMLLALGMTLVISSGGIDLSVGAVMALAGALAAALLHADVSLPLTLVAALGVSLIAGLWNGMLVAIAGIPPIVATLILMVAGRGIAQLITDGQIITIASDSAFLLLGRGILLGLPAPVVLAFAIILVIAVIVRTTSLGVFIEAVGGNEEAARYAGLPVRTIRLTVYSLMGILAGLAGLTDTADIAAADANNSGLYLELDAILAVVIGGTALAGGACSITGAILGALIIQTLSTTILMADFGGDGVPVEYNLIIKAGVVLLVCLLQSGRTQRWIASRRGGRR